MCLSLNTFVCLPSLEIDEGDRLLSADLLNDARTESDGRPLRSPEWRSMRASYFPQLFQFVLNGDRRSIKTLAIKMIGAPCEGRR
jgi:hypothetical protein